MKPSLPEPLRPMLATTGAIPAGPGWAFEFKWDGVRAIVAAAGAQVRLTSRNGNDVSLGYPELTASGLGRERSVLLDGEIVALDASGRPSFARLQHRMHVRGPSVRLQEQVPVSLYVFDALEVDGQRLLGESYDTRRRRLTELGLDALERIEVPPSIVDVSGAQMLDIARSHGLEGVVAKRQGSRYDPGRRSPAWIKTALLQAQEVLVAGWTPGEGRRGSTFGALLLGAHDHQGRLRFLGHVGTGFTDAMLRDLLVALEPLSRRDSPFDEEVPSEHARRARWVEPSLVGEVEYRTLTPDGRLRHAAWRGLRPDKQPDEVTWDLPH